MAEPEAESLKIKGRIRVTGQILSLTGLRIGASGTGLQLGGVDLPVIRNPLDNQPYIPGSSIRGKLRSLLEREWGRPLLKKVQKPPAPLVRIHECQNGDSYNACCLCRIFGVSADFKDPHFPSRLLVRDARLNKTSAKELDRRRTDLPYTQVKMEVAIDRITAQSGGLRNVERVPAGAYFDFEMVFLLYDEDDAILFQHIPLAIALLEDDYLGGHGSRGSGQVRFRQVSVVLRPNGYCLDRTLEQPLYEAPLTQSKDDEAKEESQEVKDPVTDEGLGLKLCEENWEEKIRAGLASGTT